MTRSVADAAWFMQVLSLPDARDSMSLPFQEIAWDQFDQGVEKLKGLRIGLLLEAGCGLAVEPEVRAAVEHAARLFERAGAVVAPMRPFMTQAMLDGMDHFWRMRSHVDMKALAPQKQGARCCPTSSNGPTARPAWTAKPCSRPSASSTRRAWPR